MSLLPFSHRIACITTPITCLISVICICLIAAWCCPEFISGSSGALVGIASSITHHFKFVLDASTLIATSCFANVIITALISLTAALCSSASA